MINLLVSNDTYIELKHNIIVYANLFNMGKQTAKFEDIMHIILFTFLMEFMYSYRLQQKKKSFKNTKRYVNKK